MQKERDLILNQLANNPPIKSPVWRLFFRPNALYSPYKEKKMFEHIGCSHYEVEGAICGGILYYVGYEVGARGMICIYRCGSCGTIIRILEN